MVRADAAFEQGVAVDHQVMRCDRRGHLGACGLDELGRLGRGDVLEYDLQRREVGDDPGEDPVDEHRLAIEDVDRLVGHFAVEEQRHADPLHRREHWIDQPDVRHAMRRIGRGVGRIELAGGEHAFGEPTLDFARIGAVGEIGGHQGLKGVIGRQRSQDPFAIGARGRHRRHWRGEVRHDDRAGELARRLADDRRKHRPVADVDVPVVRPSQDQAILGSGKHEDFLTAFDADVTTVPTPATAISPRRGRSYPVGELQTKRA